MTGIWIALTLAAMAAPGSAESTVVQAPALLKPAVTNASLTDPALLERYTGTYKSDAWTAKVAVSKKGQLTLQINGLRPVVLIADSEAQFHPEGVKATLVFHSDAQGTSHFILQREGTQIRANRKRARG